MSTGITKRCPPCQQGDCPNCATPLNGGPGSGFALGCCCDLLDDPGIPITITHIADPEQAIRDFQQQVRADEEALTAAGWRCLSIAHGDPERQEDLDALEQLARTFWAQPTSGPRQIAGGNDYTTYRAGPPAEDADRVIAAVQAVAEERNPGWWRITPTAHPDFGWWSP